MKKITKILDSVMSGLKRTCVAKAIAVVAVATIAMNSFAWGANPVADLQGVDGLAGQNFEYIKNNTTTEGNYDVVMGKKFFLYNEKTGKFLTIGGYWGTHVALADYGKPLFVIMKNAKDKEVYFVHNMATTMTKDQGPYIGWNVPAKGKPTEDTGVYADKKKEDSSGKKIYGWALEFVNGDANNACKLKTKNKNSYLGLQGDDVYLCGVPSSVDAGKTCEAYTTAEIKNKNLTGYDTWRIMTYQQVYDLQLANTENMKNSIDLSFMLKCPGFQRGDNDIVNWHTYNYVDGKKDDENVGFASFGMFKQYNPIAKWDKNQLVDNITETPYEFDGRSYYITQKDKVTGSEDYQRRVSKYFCASITNQRGIVYQDVVVSLPGTYVIECKGYSKTEKAALVAGVLNPNYDSTNPNGEPMMYNGVLNRTMLSQTSNMDATEYAALHIGENNMDYAGKAFFDSSKFTNSVVVVVPKEAIANGTATIRLGVMVGNGKEDNAVEGDEWTVFDDFRLLYASKTTTADLILDEDRADLQYLLSVNDPLQNKTLRLNKTFELHKWNTFVLPVNLTLKQLRDAFGPNTRLAELDKLTKSGIEFQSVKFDGMADDDIALHAYKPYLIIPEKGRIDNKKAYTAEFVNAGTGEEGQTIKVGIGKDHYIIPKVSLSVDDLQNVDKKTWATTVSKSTDGQMQAWGTLARTFGTVNDDVENGYQFKNNGQIITGRDNLIGSYFFDNGKMYHSATRPRGLRGFSCWFKPAEGAQKNAQFTLDGVTQSGTTALDDIFADGEQPVSRFAQGVYNLNGQLVKQGNSTAGLPSGLYIVNGKKCIVR